MKTLILTVLLTAVASFQAVSGILAGPVTNAANGHVYYLLTQNTWTASEAEAVSLGGHLATIDDAAEQDWVFTTFGSVGGVYKALWIGLTDQTTEGVFTWASGSAVTYAHWAPGEPNNTGGSENFVHMWPPTLGAESLWNDLTDSSTCRSGGWIIPVHGVVEVDPFARPSNLIVNGSFETPFLPIGAAYYQPASDLAPWQSDGTFVEIWVSPLTNELAAEGRQHLEIQSTSGGTTSVWQTATTVVDEDYQLSFFHSPRPSVRSSLTVSINSQSIVTLNEDGSASTAFRWLKFKTNFTATATATTLMFSDSPQQGAGTHIDNVVLERMPVSSTIRVSEVEICWETVATKSYQVQYRSALTANSWTNWGGPVQGNGGTMCIKDAVPAGEPQRVYRVMTP